MSEHDWYDGDYPGFEEYGVPTQAQIDHYLAWKARDDERKQWLKDNPLQGCKDITAPEYMALLDQVLHQYYAPALCEALNRPSLLSYVQHTVPLPVTQELVDDDRPGLVRGVHEMVPREGYDYPTTLRPDVPAPKDRAWITEFIPWTKDLPDE